MAKMAPLAPSGVAMKSMSAKEAKNAFGLLLDTARAEPVTIVKHGRRVAVLVSVEEYDRLVDERAQANAVKKPGGRKE
jgi:prevent-host-death family protein